MLKLIAVIALLSTSYVTPVRADRDHDGDSRPAWSYDHTRGAPVPIAGAGLPVLVVVGGLWLYRRWRRRA